MKQNTSFDINYAVMEVKDININYYNKSRVIDDYEYLAYRMLAEKIRYNNVSKLSIALVKLIESNNLSVNALRIVTMLNTAQLTENTRKTLLILLIFTMMCLWANIINLAHTITTESKAKHLIMQTL